MTAYIFKSSLSLIILFGLYWFLLRKEKLFVFNRFFLLLSVGFSLTVPFISIPVNFQVSPSLEAIVPASGNLIPEISNVNSNQQYIEMQSSEVDISAILLVVYISGVILFLIRLLRNIYIMGHRIKISEKISFEGYRIVLTNDKAGPCCFFRNIFINRDDYLNGRIDRALLEHEKEHARQSHTIDIMLIELMKISYWFNPIYLLYDRAIRINHEYLADNGVISEKTDIKSYADKLLGFITCKSNMSLASGSNHTDTRMRLTMMMKSRSKRVILGTRITMTLCTGLALFMLLSFKESYDSPSVSDLSETATELQQNSVRGIVMTEDGKPLSRVLITVVAPVNTPTNFFVETGSDGRFVLNNIQGDASLRISCFGYRDQTLKPDFISEMVIKMVKDPNYKMGVRTRDLSYYHEGENVRIRMTDDKDSQSLIVIDDKITNFKGEVTLKRDDIATGKVLRGKEATDKYGENGKYGVIEITTKKRADELGLKITPPSPIMRQQGPDNYPTFKGKNPYSFQDWVASMVKYPAEARTKKIEGWVSVNFTINLDGTVSNVKSTMPVIPLLSNEVIRVVKSSPKWDPPKNKDTGKLLNASVTFKFKLPDNILSEPIYNYVEEMPQYPGGDAELLNFIKNNTKYPEQAKAENIEGSVIIRFIVSTEGNSEGISVLKGVHPLLDAEAIRVVSLMKGWKPGMQDGKPVNTWYMVPVNFALPQTN